jgi:hypothetical protein
VSCECNIVGLLSTSYQGIFSASIDGSTVIEIAEDGTVLFGQTVSNLSIGAYAFLPGGDKFLGASCPASAQASIPWITREDCETGQVHFIPKAGGKASITNWVESGIQDISLECDPDVVSKSFDANATGGPTSPYLFSDRKDGYNLVYTGNPISVETGRPQVYDISLGFVGTLRAHLQSFNLSVSPPDVARVQYSFVFAGVAV